MLKALALVIALLSSLFSSPPLPSSSIPTPRKCDSTVTIGDSLSLTLHSYVSESYGDLRVGNGWSIRDNGLDSARRYRQDHPGRVCWIIALGTNDSSSTSSPSDLERFDMMMEVIGSDPVLWVNVWYDSAREGYQEPNALIWNSMLIEKKKLHPNMKIFDWATIAKSHPEWFIGDGIHYNSEGAKQRAWWLTMISSLVLKLG
jgi:hypothetical protein